jgi:hypothetical protein
MNKYLNHAISTAMETTLLFIADDEERRTFVSIGKRNCKLSSLE